MAANPVVLVHGIDDTLAVFNPMSLYLRALGWSVYSLDLIPCNGDAGLDQLAYQLQEFVHTTFTPDQRVDLVGFSMGGIVSRYYMQRLGGVDRVQRFVTIASPHHGTLTAHFRWNAGAQQMKPNSPFLVDLNRDVERLNQVNFTSIWSPFDLMIFPASSSRLPVGQEIVVDVLTHPWMLRDPRSLRAVAEALSQPLQVLNAA